MFAPAGDLVPVALQALEQGGTLAVAALGRFRKLPLWQLAGVAIPALALGYALGRVGCQISGDGVAPRDVDFVSSAAANPALGIASDILIRHGGSAD